MNDRRFAILYTADATTDAEVSSKGNARELASRLAGYVTANPTVGGRGALGIEDLGQDDSSSDIDLYVYSRQADFHGRAATGGRGRGTSGDWERDLGAGR